MAAIAVALGFQALFRASDPTRPGRSGSAPAFSCCSPLPSSGSAWFQQEKS
ncbi:hypothetical protein [Rhizobium halophilum]|uniref:hypothetical protein n=1 Tax=Rhizobium halophilum TaxID=2846852 RepID=UPI00374D7F6B